MNFKKEKLEMTTMQVSNEMYKIPEADVRTIKNYGSSS